MTREKLIHLIYTSDDERVCNCNDCLRKKELDDFKVGDCIRCAEKKLDEFLAEHDKQIRAEERKSVIEEFRNYLKTVTPCEMPQEYWDMGVDNTCDRMLKENK